MYQRETEIEVFPTPHQAAQAAANAVAGEIRRLLARNAHATAIFDGLNQPVTFFESLVQTTGIDWTQVIVFQAAEYLGADGESSKSGQRLLTESFLLQVPIVTFHALRGDAANQRAADANFSARLSDTPPDFAFLGFDLLSALERDVRTDEAVGLISIKQQRVVAITAGFVARTPRLFALGRGEAPLVARKHRNAEIFVAINQ